MKPLEGGAKKQGRKNEAHEKACREREPRAGGLQGRRVSGQGGPLQGGSEPHSRAARVPSSHTEKADTQVLPDLDAHTSDSFTRPHPQSQSRRAPETNVLFLSS